MCYINKDEQKALTQIKKKISTIQTDHIHSKGLTDTEAEIAAKVGLIDPQQMWWWKEDWQKGEREAENNIAKGEVTEALRLEIIRLKSREMPLLIFYHTWHFHSFSRQKYNIAVSIIPIR